MTLPKPPMRAFLLLVALLASLPAGAAEGGASTAAPAGGVYYQCPGNLFTNTITAREAEAKGCKTREAASPTTIPAPRPRPVQSARGPEARVDSSEQKARDADARKILEAELAKSEAQLDALRKEYNNGTPERRGDERNYQRYADRVSELKASIARTEADISALKRELGKTP